MKRLLVLLALAFCVVAVASAQQRAVGARFGYGLELSYQHYVKPDVFIEADLGLDFLGKGGFKATAIYDLEIGHPDWTPQGEWMVYVGPGAALGVVCNSRNNPSGFMFGICGQLGIEYTFPFPLAVSLDVRPMLGYHFGDREVYSGGLYGLMPTLGARYRF